MSLFEVKPDPVIFQLGVDDTAKAYLLQTARWTKFMAILGFVFTGFLLLFGVFAALNAADFMRGIDSTGGSSYSSPYAALMVIIYLLVGVIYIYPTITLLQFSTNMKAAISMNDSSRFNTALRHQRNMWRFIGIMMIALILLYGFVIIIALTGYLSL